MGSLLQILGVPASVIVLETHSRNTRENAREVHRILEPRGSHRVLIVTTALHMHRALPFFKRKGFDAIPVPTDFWDADPDLALAEKSEARRWLLDMLPDAQNFDHSTQALREHLALAYYGLRGLID